MYQLVNCAPTVYKPELIRNYYIFIPKEPAKTARDNRIKHFGDRVQERNRAVVLGFSCGTSLLIILVQLAPFSTMVAGGLVVYF